MSISIARAAAAPEPISLEALRTRLGAVRSKRRTAFDEARMAVLAGVADRLLRDRAMAANPAIQSFAFFTRKGALQAMKAAFTDEIPKGALAFGRGIAFHLPPANVDTLFLYSWAISYLAGNVNVVRLPSEVPPAVAAVLDALLAALEMEGEPDLFLHYKADEATNRALSAESDARLVWGGDAKAALFGAYPVRMGGKTLDFSDRFSFCALDGAALAAMSEASLGALAKRFANDVFVFGQMACSSPHVLYVRGDRPAHGSAVARFLAEADAAASAREDRVPASHAVQKFVDACLLAATEAVERVVRLSNETTVVRMAPEGLPLKPVVGGGFISVQFVEVLGDLLPLISESSQTMTHAGFEAESLSRFAAEAGPRGLCRIVPVGQALQFDRLWDGYDLLGELTRLIVLR